MYNVLLKSNQSFPQWNLHVHFEIVFYSLEHFVGQFFNFYIHCASSCIQHLVSCISVFNLVPFRSTLFNKQSQWVEGIHYFFTRALVAFGCVFLAFATAHGAFLGELLDKTRHNLLFGNDLSCSITFGASLDMRRIICSWTPTMRTNNLAIVLEFKFRPSVELFKSSPDLQVNWRPSLLLLLAKTKHICKPSMLLLIWLVQSFFSSFIVLAALILVWKTFVSCADICELF